MKDLTFAEACETTKSMEAAEADAKAIASIDTAAVPATVQLVSKHQRGQGKQSSSQSLLKTSNSHATVVEGATIFPTSANLRTLSAIPAVRGHIAPACRSKQRQPQGPPPLKRGQTGTKANYVGVEADPAEEELNLFTLERGSREVKPIRYQLTLDGIPVWMELDTGAEVSVLPESTYLSLFPEKKLVNSAAVLKTYTGEPFLSER